jgi:hypothetical protein
MDSGFETIGNATLIVYDGRPVLVTDPWVEGHAYFGSWTRAHEIPEEQMEAIKQCEYVWVSHGHPDHLSIRSLNLLKDKKILLGDHVGGRIDGDLRRLGFNVQVLRDREWTNLSAHLNVMCVTDYNQDSLLLVDIGGNLLVNLNDMTAKGWGPLVQKTVRQFKRSYLLQGFGYGDADMINFVDEAGNRVSPPGSTGEGIGKAISRVAHTYGVTHVIPFSSLHKYQREDSVWAREYSASLDDFRTGFDSDRCELLPAYISHDNTTGSYRRINPPETPDTVLDPKEFGDDWSEHLEAKEAKAINRYFRSIQHLETAMDFINIRVGGEDNIIELRKKGFKKGIVFEAPRHSLMRAIRFEIFDDLLIGNFMRTRLVGQWPRSMLYPEFTPYVTKYSDNGRAKTKDDLRQYFHEYRRRAPLDYLRHRIQQRTAQAVKTRIDADSEIYRLAQKSWWFMRRHIGA